MSTLLIISFGGTLIYLSIAERMRTYNVLIALQGLLLFGIEYVVLNTIDAWHLGLILLETLIIKVIVLPYFIHRLLIRKRGGAVATGLPGFVSLTIVTVIIFLSFLLSRFLHDDHVPVKYFTAAIAAIFTGLYLIIVHKQVFAHMMGYLIIENGIFLLSLAVGNEMPITVDLAIQIDVFSSILILGIFINRLEAFSALDVDQLNDLRDS